MTPRQRLLAVLVGERADILPWFTDLGYWYAARKAEGTLPAQYEGEEGFVKLHVDYHAGYYLGGAGVAGGSSQGVEHSAQTDDTGLTTNVWKTPVGEIRGQTKYLPQTFSSAPIRWAVRTPDDLRVLRYISEAITWHPAYEGYERKRELAGEQGHPTVAAPRSPISQMLAQWTGVTNLTYLAADAPDALESTVLAMQRAADGAFDAIAGCDTPFMLFGDNLSGEVVTRLFERYQFDYYVRRIEQMHVSGKKCGVHIDGTLRGIVPLVVRTGMNFIESVTPKPVGDVAIEDLRELAGPELVLFGGMPGAMMSPIYSDGDVRRQVEQIVQHHWEHGRFILGVADQVPPDANLDRVRFIADLCEELTG